MSVNQFKSKKRFQAETVEEFKARGGKVQKCPTRQIRKFSSCPSLYLPKKKKPTLDVQGLLDNAVGTEHEDEVIAFIESQGYEVS